MKFMTSITIIAAFLKNRQLCHNNNYNKYTDIIGPIRTRIQTPMKNNRDDIDSESNAPVEKEETTREDLHKSLKGPERLLSVVELLGRTCPWTASIDAPTMLQWLTSEVSEFRDELRYRTILSRSNPTAAALQERKSEVVSELGDILFDALMLELICRRDFGFRPGEAWNAASAKVERRTPYMKEWGDGVSVATTVEETEAFWQAAKAREPKKQKPTAQDLAAASPPKKTRQPDSFPQKNKQNRNNKKLFGVLLPVERIKKAWGGAFLRKSSNNAALVAMVGVVVGFALGIAFSRCTPL